LVDHGVEAVVLPFDARVCVGVAVMPVKSAVLFMAVMLATAGAPIGALGGAQTAVAWARAKLPATRPRDEDPPRG
jgi:hypothetical protein